MENLFKLLYYSNYKIQEKFLTEIVKKELLSEEYYKGNLEVEIENIFSRTKDEAKRLHLLADYVKVEYAQYRNDDIYDEIFKVREKLILTDVPGDVHLADMMRDLAEWIMEAGYRVDCYEVAKALIEKYKKENKASKKKAA